MGLRIGILLLTLALPAAAKKNFDTATVFDWREASSPQISPDGRFVVSVLRWADRMSDQFYSNLWIASTDGKDLRPLTDGNFRDAMPRLSPDGKRLAYLSNRTGKTQIHVRWLEGNQEAILTNGEEAPSNIAWSPDGSWIAYTMHVAAKPAWTVHMPEKPAGAKWADPPAYVTRLHWRQDAEGLLRPGNEQLFLVPSLGGAPRQLTTGEGGHTGEPSWTPDSATLLFTGTVAGPDAEYNLAGGEIFSVRAADGKVSQLTSREGPDHSPVVSPDGKHVAYLGYDDQRRSYAVTHLYVMNIDGSNPRRLATEFDRDVHSPRWAADSSGIYFAADDHGASNVHFAKLDGSVKAVTTGKARFTSGYAFSDSFTISRGGQIAILRSTPEDPNDVVTFSVQHPASIVRLTQSNDGLLAGRNVGVTEEFRYDSFDGRPIQGWILKPPDFDASKKYPLLLEIHGGPHGMYGSEFQHEFQIYAASGFVVLFTNPRGSTGYGEEFGDVIHARYPGDDFTDLMKGVDAVIAKGYIDPKRMAITGGSGGGLLTAWAIGHTDRFAAAVSQYPVTNWFTQAGVADGGHLFAANWMKAMPWENPKQYIEHSPVFFAQNFKTPTMIITGTSDYRTPIAQSEELYFALKERKVDAVLVEIPGEPHGIRGASPSHRIAKMENILGWIEKYTKPATPPAGGSN